MNFERSLNVTLPKLGLLAMTRALAGAGIGFLFSERIDPEKRKAVGWTLLAVGALSTIPLAIEIFSANRRIEAGDRPEINQGHSGRIAAEQRTESSAIH